MQQQNTKGQDSSFNSASEKPSQKTAEILPDIRSKTLCVVGLGYVGLPLAEAFSAHQKTIGYRRNQAAVDELNRTMKERGNENFIATTDPARIREADIVIICVPTPVMKNKLPDLRPILDATVTVGLNLKQGAIVVGESTVWPGLTEELMIPLLEEKSGMRCGRDFFVGYSPERVNPGDDDHTIDKITKVVAGMDDTTTQTLAALYSQITTVHVAPNIRTAEAAKVIENVQRDLNIALMNELSIIFDKMGLETKAVLEAAATKWNFHRYRPGLVGGHCIPVDPYYLVNKAQELGYHPQVILAGRAINDAMPRHVAQMAIRGLNDAGKVIKGSRVLIMGLTYKENVPDTRESPVEEMVKEFEDFHLKVYGFDPLLSDAEIAHFGAEPVERLNPGMQVDCILVNAPHDIFRQIPVADLLSICNGKPVLVDVAGIFRDVTPFRNGCYYRTL
ncbi:nucleotide sugar dehydrogenase [Methanocalculus taiwanensis]|uniref:UDP-N-acetyl-D-mannosamine dehydrogenase n=1 Tax=Methanocalculus taiwanensis TaxID=106207 RepID=A0ABD4TK23_9EURY|nr:nucleotide sugar dehydrogenase [Methanocalculus taiwanensis]MCQ1538180.1 nucleotide sugar dehydrogenase [Methanocalculus taiwanensis]